MVGSDREKRRRFLTAFFFRRVNARDKPRTPAIRRARKLDGPYREQS
jgi:hypothetical protein